MAGYIGSKAVNLSTTGADIAGDADVSGALDVGGAFTSQGIDDNATSTAMTLDASGNVGIGTSSPNKQLHLKANTPTINLHSDNASSAQISFTNSGGVSEQGFIKYEHSGDYAGSMQFRTSGSEAMRLDSSGNLLVGNTSFAHDSAGALLASNGRVYSTVDGNFTFTANRLSSDGQIIRIQKDTATVGAIGSNNGRIYVASTSTGIRFAGNDIWPTNGSGAGVDNAKDVGSGIYRWDDIFATNGTIQTSDRNEKQDIAELSDAEQRVAVAAKGLMRKFRWKDKVAEKGDEARTHFGIIAQDLQAAFSAEGLDAGDYAMFISSTWWEHDVEVPAVEAVAEVLDEEGNVATEAVEAVDAYTRTDTYDTQEEAPEGATERTRLGVRYSELLAFIIGAL